jgi:uncharacterized protein YutE (UPF0331/DUF86 family)
MKIREEIVRTKMKEIEESVKIVSDNLPKTFKEFISLGLGLIKYGIYKRIEFSIENVLGISLFFDDIIKYCL